MWPKSVAADDDQGEDGERLVTPPTPAPTHGLIQA